MTRRLSAALTAVALGLASTPASAGRINDLVFLQTVPTLDEIGLGALIALVAGVAGWAVRRRGGRDRDRR